MSTNTSYKAFSYEAVVKRTEAYLPGIVSSKNGGYFKMKKDKKNT